MLPSTTTVPSCTAKSGVLGLLAAIANPPAPLLVSIIAEPVMRRKDPPEPK